MKQIFRKEVLIGLLVIIALVILYFGINFLKGVNIFKAANYYYASYNNVERPLPYLHLLPSTATR